MMEINWRERIGGIHRSAQLHEPTTEDQLDLAEQALRQVLPEDLKDLLLQTNGLSDKKSRLDVVWPLDRIQNENQSLRTSLEYMAQSMPLDALLFFSAAGADGVLFGFPITKAGAILPAVFAWYPISDDRVRVAESLDDFLRRWFAGELKV